MLNFQSSTARITVLIRFNPVLQNQYTHLVLLFLKKNVAKTSLALS